MQKRTPQHEKDFRAFVLLEFKQSDMIELTTLIDTMVEPMTVDEMTPLVAAEFEDLTDESTHLTWGDDHTVVKVSIKGQTHYFYGTLERGLLFKAGVTTKEVVEYLNNWEICL